MNKIRIIESKIFVINFDIYNSINKKRFIVKAPNQIRDYICTFDLVEAIYKSIKLKKSIVYVLEESIVLSPIFAPRPTTTPG